MKKNEKGFVLILALILISVLMILLVGVLGSMKQTLKGTNSVQTQYSNQVFAKESVKRFNDAEQLFYSYCHAYQVPGRLTSGSSSGACTAWLSSPYAGKAVLFPGMTTGSTLNGYTFTLPTSSGAGMEVYPTVYPTNGHQSYCISWTEGKVRYRNAQVSGYTGCSTAWSLQ